MKHEFDVQRKSFVVYIDGTPHITTELSGDDAQKAMIKEYGSVEAFDKARDKLTAEEGILLYEGTVHGK